METLFHRTGAYLETRSELIRLKAIDISAEMVSTLAANAAILLPACFFLLCFNIGAALWLGGLLGHYFYGFFVLAGFYALASLILLAGRRRWIKVPLSDWLITKLLK